MLLKTAQGTFDHLLAHFLIVAHLIAAHFLINCTMHTWLKCTSENIEQVPSWALLKTCWMHCIAHCLLDIGLDNWLLQNENFILRKHNLSFLIVAHFDLCTSSDCWSGLTPELFIHKSLKESPNLSWRRIIYNPQKKNSERSSNRSRNLTLSLVLLYFGTCAVVQLGRVDRRSWALGRCFPCCHCCNEGLKGLRAKDFLPSQDLVTKAQ